MALNHKVNHHHHHTVKVIEQCQVGPPPGSVPQTSIPLSFFDLPWLCCPLTKRIFFYEFPHPTNHFLQKVLPTLKHSLSLTLQNFFPFSSNIVFPPKPNVPHILYSKGDSLTFTVAESTTFDFNNLVSDTPRHVTCLHPFVPILPSPRPLEDGTLLIPPMAIQVTILPNAGFTICMVFRHVVADGRAFHHFLKCWASVCGSRGDLRLPLHDRGMIQDPNGFKTFFLEALWNLSWESIQSMGLDRDVPSDMFRRTFVVSRDHVENMKRYVSAKCQYYQGTLHVSTFVVTCSLIWVCKVKSEVTNVDATLANDDELYMMVLADCRNIPESSIPSTYFGNCLVCGNATVKRSKLVGQNGIFEAAVAIGNQVRRLKSEGYNKGVETLMSSLSKYAIMGQQMLVITGSPKLDAYETDFGWGKPKLSEVVHVDSPGLMSLSDCRDKESGIEVGVALGRAQMEKFNIILEELLADISAHE